MLEEIINKNEGNKYDNKNDNIINDNNFNIINDNKYEDENEEEEINANGIYNNKLNKREVKYYIGSKFKEDENKKEYNYNMLNKIKYQMEKNNILVLQDLEIVYPSLYELFNRNFFELNGKKFTYLGKSHIKSLVNEEFKVIIYLEKENILKEDPPFLNRFQKHLMSMTNILEDRYLELADEIYSVLKKIISFNLDNNNKIFLNQNLKFIDINEVRGLIYIAIKKNIKNKNEIIKSILEKIVPSFTEDFMIYIEKFGFKSEYGLYYNLIIDIYKKNYTYNLYNYLEKTKSRFSIIYTFSPINDNLFENKEYIKNQYFAQTFNKDSFKEIFINEINSIIELDKLILDYISENNYNLCILKFGDKDLVQLTNVVNLIDDYIQNEDNYNFLNKDKKTQKTFIILIHLSRVNIKYEININKNSISYISNIPQIFIDNLNNRLKNFSDIIDCQNTDILFKIINTQDLIEQFKKSIQYFLYNIINEIKNKEIENKIDSNTYRSLLVDNLKNNSELINIIKTSINLLSKNEKDYLSSILYNISNNEESYDFMDNLYNKLKLIFENYVNKLIYLFDNNQIFTCVIFNNDILKSKLIINQISNYIQSINNENSEKIDLNGINRFNKIGHNILIGIKIPFIQNILKENIFDFIKNNITKKYLECDSFIMRSKISLDNIILEKEKYKNQMNQLKLILKNEILNYPFINNILYSNDISLIKHLFNDCYYAFLLKSNYFNKYYDELSKLLDIIIQIRLQSIIDDDSFKDEINIESSLIDLIINIEEEKKNNINNNLNKIILNNNENNNEEINNNININAINEKKYSINFIDYFIITLNFIESYSKEIYYILEIYNFLLDYNKELFNEIKDLINKNTIKMDDERNPEYSKILKCCFYYVIESLLRQIKDINSDQYEFYKKILRFLPNLIKLETKFLLFSKELFTMEILNKIITCSANKKDDHIKIYINNIIKLILSMPDLIIEKNYKKLLVNLSKVNEILKTVFGNSNDYEELLNDILLNQYKIVKYYQFREEIINKLLKENNINISYNFIEIIVGTSSRYEPSKILEKGKKNAFNFEEYILDFIINNEDLILYYFEIIIENYFVNIKNGQIDDKIKYNKLLGDISKKYLINAINNIENKEKINIFVKLFSIAYIKRYIINYLDLLFTEKFQILIGREEINNILYRKAIIIIQEIKFFTLKYLLIKFNYDLGKLINLNRNDSLSDYFSYNENFEFKLCNESVNVYYFSYPNIEKNDKNFDLNDYKQLLDKIKNSLNLNKENIEIYYNKLKNSNNLYDILYTYISYFIYKSYLNNNNGDISLKKVFDIFGYFAERDGLKNSLAYFIKDTKDKKFEKILSKIRCENMDINAIFRKIEILLYAFRFYLNILTLKNNKNNFYYLLSIKPKDTINSNYIPGKLISNEFKIIYEQIKDNLKHNPKNYEYLYSCGHNCSPNNINQICQKCKFKKENKLSLFGKKNYGRVFLNGKECESFYLKYPKIEPYILLKELEKKINEEIKPEKGIKAESKQYFLEKNKEDISYITFRLLNFILYGIFFYSNIDNMISDEELSNYLIESMTCFEIIEKDWEILDLELKRKGIPNIHIFMDNIFHKLIVEINKIKTLKNLEDLNNYENTIKSIIQIELNNKNTINNFLENRNKYIDIKSNEELEKIIEENLYNNNLQFLKKKYPEIEFFTIYKLPSFEDFKNEFNNIPNNKDYYPIINIILNDNSNIKYLKYLPKINELCNFMIDYCSYKFTRDGANKKNVYDEIKDKDDLINEFIVIFEELRPYVNEYGRFNFKNEKGETLFNSLNNKKIQFLSNLCVDEGECNYGMVLAALYKKLIFWQNSYINQILYSKNESHKIYNEFFESEIMIQDCNENDIINIPTNEELLNNYIVKNTYKKKYCIIEYNFKKIEEQLAINILPNIKKFVSDNNKCLKYVIYKYEGFKGNKDNLITIFNDKYDIKELTKNEMNIIIEYIKSIKNKSEQKILDFWSSLQLLIDIILENNYNGEILISKIIRDNNKKESLILLNDLFNNSKITEKNKGTLFKVNSLMSVFNIFELICWEKIKENLIDNYLKEINDNMMQVIDIFFNDDNNKNIITRKDLSTAIRRFVSRYLLGRRSEKEIDKNSNLIDNLYKKELWNKKDIVDNKQFEKELNLLFNIKNKSMISIGQATKLQEYLGDEIELYLKDINENNNNAEIIKILLNTIKDYWTKKDNNINSRRNSVKSKNTLRNASIITDNSNSNSESVKNEDDDNSSIIGY